MIKVSGDNLMRAASGLTGPLLFALSNFIFAMTLQQSSNAEQFGFFSFAQLVIATGVGFSNGLFGNPLVVSIANNDSKSFVIMASFFKANLLYCMLGGVALIVLLWIAGGSGVICYQFLLLGILAWLRWFLRSCELANHRRSTVIAMDVFYAVPAIIGAIVLAMNGAAGLFEIVMLQAVCSTISLIPVLKLLHKLASRCLHVSLQAYKSSFIKHGIWAIIASVATEVAITSPLYVITLFLGATTFAPIALAALLFRPLGVVLTGLVQFERPRMALQIGRRSAFTLDRDVRFIKKAVGVTWAANLAAVSIVMLLLPSALIRPGYDETVFVSSIFLIGAITLLRSMREPSAAALQAGGQFKEVSRIAVACAPVTLLVALAAVTILPSITVAALVGSLLGEVLGLMLIKKSYDQFKARLVQPLSLVEVIKL